MLVRYKRIVLLSTCQRISITPQTTEPDGFVCRSSETSEYTDTGYSCSRFGRVKKKKGTPKLTTHSPRLATRQDIRLEAPVCATTVDEFSVKNLGSSSVRCKCASSSALLWVVFGASGPVTVLLVARFRCVIPVEETVDVIFSSGGSLPPVSGTAFFLPSPVTYKRTHMNVTVHKSRLKLRQKYHRSLKCWTDPDKNGTVLFSGNLIQTNMVVRIILRGKSDPWRNCTFRDLTRFTASTAIIIHTIYVLSPFENERDRLLELSKNIKALTRIKCFIRIQIGNCYLFIR